MNAAVRSETIVTRNWDFYGFAALSLEAQSASRAAMVDRVSPSCMKMELIRAISSAVFPSAMQQAMALMDRANSQDFIYYHLSTLYVMRGGKIPSISFYPRYRLIHA